MSKVADFNDYRAHREYSDSAELAADLRELLELVRDKIAEFEIYESELLAQLIAAEAQCQDAIDAL